MHTVGGVIKEGEPIMLIVPEGEKLLVEAKVQPQDIDQLYIGQPGGAALLGLQPAHHAQATGGCQPGVADVVQDTRVGQNAPPYYMVLG